MSKSNYFFSSSIQSTEHSYAEGLFSAYVYVHTAGSGDRGPLDSGGHGRGRGSGSEHAAGDESVLTEALLRPTGDERHGQRRAARDPERHARERERRNRRRLRLLRTDSEEETATATALDTRGLRRMLHVYAQTHGAQLPREQPARHQTHRVRAARELARAPLARRAPGVLAGAPGHQRGQQRRARRTRTRYAIRY